MPMTQQNRKVIFDTIRKSLEAHCPPMVLARETATAYEIIGNTPHPYGSKKKIVPGMYFASVVARKDMVSFYFMPIYYRQKDYADVAPTLLKCLTGKACFNFRNVEQIDTKELTAMMKMGVAAWKKLGYLR